MSLMSHEFVRFVLQYLNIDCTQEYKINVYDLRRNYKNFKRIKSSLVKMLHIYFAETGHY